MTASTVVESWRAASSNLRLNGSGGIAWSRSSTASIGERGGKIPGRSDIKIHSSAELPVRSCAAQNAGESLARVRARQEECRRAAELVSDHSAKKASKRGVTAQRQG